MNLDFLKGRYGNQLLLLFIIVLTSTAIFSMLALSFIGYVDGVSIDELSSSQNISIPSNYVSIVLTQLGTFLLPALVFTSLMKMEPKRYFKLALPRGKFWLILLPLFVSCFFLIQGLTYLNEFIPFSQAIVESDNQQEEFVKQILTYRGGLSIVLNVLIFAFLPAICEEFLFRGVMQKLFIKATKNIHLGIVITSLIFALVHGRYLTFFPLLFMGLVLGYLFVYSKSIWTNILLHFINNAVGVVLYMYFSSGTQDELNYLSVLLSLVVFLGITWIVSKEKVEFNEV